MKRRFVIIGMSDNPVPQFPDEAIEEIGKSKVFSGGVRHRSIVGEILPFGYEWIDIKSPMDNVFRQYEGVFAKGVGTIVVFASGDPLFFGFANTVMRELPDSEIRLFPYFNSLQILAHRSLIRYDDILMVSLTGRPWCEFDNALIRRTNKIGVLTDREHTPSAIGRRMMEYGYVGYEMIVGERLGNIEHERISRVGLEEATEMVFDCPNCVILIGRPQGSSNGGRRQATPLQGEYDLETSVVGRPQGSPLQGREKISECRQTVFRHFGIPDSMFEHLDGRARMITKAPIRLLSLQAMELPSRSAMWDVGFCTGSVSIEARLLFPHLEITAFEIRPECERLVHINSRRFGAPGIETVMGDFLACDLSAYPRPDAVFIGGHGGKLKEMMAKIKDVLLPGGCIVFNSVTAESQRMFEEAADELGFEIMAPKRIALNDYNPITIMKCSL